MAPIHGNLANRHQTTEQCSPVRFPRFASHPSEPSLRIFPLFPLLRSFSITALGPHAFESADPLPILTVRVLRVKGIMLAFSPCAALPLRQRSVNSNAGPRQSMSMKSEPSTSKISRRNLGQLAIGASAGLIAYTATAPLVRNAIAEAKKRTPPFVKDESGIRYYDVKSGSGYGPVEGDFVIIDYVSISTCKLLYIALGKNCASWAHFD